MNEISIGEVNYYITWIMKLCDMTLTGKFVEDTEPLSRELSNH